MSLDTGLSSAVPQLRLLGCSCTANDAAGPRNQVYGQVWRCWRCDEEQQIQTAPPGDWSPHCSRASQLWAPATGHSSEAAPAPASHCHCSSCPVQARCSLTTLNFIHICWRLNIFGFRSEESHPQHQTWPTRLQRYNWYLGRYIWYRVLTKRGSE